MPPRLHGSMSVIPAGGSQGRDPRLEYPGVEHKGALSGDRKEYSREDQAAMDSQTHDHRHHVEAQLPGHHFQISNGSNLPCDQRGDANRRVPAYRVRIELQLFYQNN